MSDLSKQQQYPECKQLYNSILQYINSDRFVPKDTLPASSLQSLFESEHSSRKVQELRNISYD